MLQPLPDGTQDPTMHSIESERNALVRMINHGDSELATILAPDDFYDASYRNVFNAGKRVIEKFDTCDFLLLCDEMRRSGELEKIGGVPFLAELFTAMAFPAESSIIVMKTQRARRETMLLDKKAKAMIRDGRVEEIPALLAEQGKYISDLLPKKPGSQKEAIIAEMEAKEHVTPTGYLTMDTVALPGGLQAGDLMLIAARPSVGKSSLATSICVNLLKAGLKPALFSLEMSRKQVITRIVCGYHKVLAKDAILRSRELINAIFDERDIDLFIGMNNLTEIERETITTTADVIIIDYFGLITMQSKENRFQQMDEISRRIKNLAITSEKPIIMLTQLNREIEKDKTTREPHLADLFGGGERDADLISFLYDPNAKETRNERNETPSDTARRMEGRKGKEIKWIVRKNRNGPAPVSVPLRFQPELFLFDEEDKRPTIYSSDTPDDSLPF